MPSVSKCEYLDRPISKYWQEKSFRERRVPLGGNVLAAIIAYGISADGADNLVASVFFHYGDLAIAASPKKCCRSSFFNSTALTHTILLFEFFTGQGNVRLQLAKTTRYLLALWIATAELLVNLNRRANSCKLAERAGIEILKLCLSDLRLLLETLELLDCFHVKELGPLSPTEGSFAATPVHTEKVIPRVADIIICVASSAVIAKEVGDVAIAIRDLLRGGLVEATHAFHNIPSRSTVFVYCLLGHGGICFNLTLSYNQILGCNGKPLVTGMENMELWTENREV